MRNRTKTVVISVLAAFLMSCTGSQTTSVNPSVSDAETEIMAAPRVSYLGPEGTYTEEAARFFFPDAGEMVAERNVNDAIQSVSENRADYAVIPQENTIGGPVTGYIDALIAQDDIFVVGEVILPISQTLMGIPGSSVEQIQTVCSHAQGLSQSEQWRKEHMPDAAVQEMESTAAAAAYVAEQQDPSIAAVAAPGAADLYGLSVLAENIQITAGNQTRFYVLAREKLKQERYPCAVLAITCRADQIDDMIVSIHSAGLELVTLHDRPEGSSLGMYHYLIEVKNDTGITAGQIETITSLDGVHFLGSFSSIEKQ